MKKASQKVSFFARVKNFLNALSTAPNPAAYTWNGYTSILSAVLLYVLWFFRILSPLQLLKHWVRQRQKRQQKKKKAKLGASSKDFGSKRGNITPAFQERYFIFWLLVMLAFRFLLPDFCGKSFIECYYLFESTVWILYYTIFRRFYEERYAIYHPLEHLLIIILILPTQALALADLYSASFRDAMLAIIGVGDGLPTWVSVLGTVYFAVTVSMIISNFPSEVKKAGRHHVIIGSGQVVSQRLLPALLSSNVQKNQVAIYSIGKNDALLGIPVKDLSVKEENTLTGEVSDQTLFWVETPSYAHMYYVNLLLAYQPGLLVVEKPITVLPDELPMLEKLVNSEYRRKLFFLSYYMLEKALPLVYLKKRLPFYEPYLCFEDRQAALEMYRELGKLKSIFVYIREGQDDRPWLKDAKNGGQLYETFLHNLLIAAEFAGLPETWSITERTVADDRILLNATAGSTAIRLEMVKNDARYNENKSRGALLQYENGTVTADFEARTATVTAGNQSQTVAVDGKKFPRKYMVQVDMVGRCFGDGLDPGLIDGLGDQIQILKWLFAQP